MQIYRWLCLGEGKDVVCRAEVEFETAEWGSASPSVWRCECGVRAEPLSGLTMSA